jgi:sulfide:quinone oxidoreductase
MPIPSSPQPRRVVVVGGGIAALEVVLALRDLAADRLEVCLVAPDVHFTLRPMAVARPFSRGSVGRLPLDRFMTEQGGRLKTATVVSVDAAARTVVCDDGRSEPYDELVLALGARAEKAFEHALTFGLGEDRDALSGVLADLEQGYSQSVAFVVPAGCTWSLPLYELALMTAEELRGMCRDGVAIHVVTPERAPLEAFGPEVAAEVAALLAEAGIALHTGVEAEVRHGAVALGPGEQLPVDAVVALPTLIGPHLPGVPRDAEGFIPVDGLGRVRGLPGVHAVGDATAGAVKQGGVASQQADLVAEDIAAAAGVEVTPTPQAPVLRGRLLTGRGERALEEGGTPVTTDGGVLPVWWPAAKVVARHLGPYLERTGLVELPVRGGGHRG